MYDEGIVYYEQMIYTFSFAASEGRRTIDVYSFNRDAVILFVNQHGFKVPLGFIKEVPYNSMIEKHIEETSLFPVTLRSNSSNEQFTIFTTADILDAVIVNTTEMIGETAWFGPLIIDEYPIFTYINDMIDKLKYAEIMDYQLIDNPDDNPDETVCDSDINMDSIKREIESDVYKKLETVERILPITIESYAAGFNSLM
jgi:hypothetical protein